MTWMILTPREAEAVKAVRVDGADMRIDALLMRMVQEKLDSRNELELSNDDMARVERAAKNWRTGFAKAFEAVLAAAGRH
jgi:hypothetical protein